MGRGGVVLEGSPRSIQPIVSSLIRPGNQIPLVLSGSKRELRTAMKVYSDPVTLEGANVFCSKHALMSV